MHPSRRLSLHVDGKELKVKDGDKETTYKVTEKTVFKAGDKDVPLDAATKRLSSDKAKGSKIEITTDGDKDGNTFFVLVVLSTNSQGALNAADADYQSILKSY